MGAIGQLIAAPQVSLIPINLSTITDMTKPTIARKQY